MSSAARRFVLLFVVAVLACSFGLAPSALAAAEPYQEGDHLGFRNILPPGTNGHENVTDAAQFLGLGVYPPHWVDQAEMYGDLVYESPGVTPAQVDQFFKDASFGVAPGNVARTYSPPLRPGVVIERDGSFGVAHVYGETRSDTIYGAGYIGAEDRLFFMDVLRHAGRAQLSDFAGGSNKAMDEEQWQGAPYTEADLQQQADQLDDLYGADGAQVQQDSLDYIAGVNAYITEARINPTKMPAEYAAIGKPLLDFQPTDIIATASLVGGIFGKGGGGEVASAQILNAARKRFGPRAGEAAWQDFRRAEDPEAPTTVQGTSFQYQVPRGIQSRAVAIPDPGSVVGPGGTGASSAAMSASASGALPPRRASAGRRSDKSKGLISLPRSASNALLVSGQHTDSGRPVAVMGPQVSYFIPEILMEQDLHCLGDCGGAPDIDARGASFPGVSPYVLLGRGPDFAWSATSAGQDIIDTFAEELCETDGSEPTVDSDHYLYQGQCVAMEVLERTNIVTPNPADPCGGSGQTACGPYTITSFRTVHGIVNARGTVRGKPVAFARQRSTYMHEVDSARGFVDLNSPERVSNAQEFQQAAHKIGFTFNWFYADDRDIAYFNSGDNPVRARGVDPNFPAWGTGQWDWQGFDPATRTADYTPFSQHPRLINQPFMTSWNNKQAPGYRAADDNFAYGPVHRSLSLDRRIQSRITSGDTFALNELVDAMEDAGTVDLRAAEVLPYMLDVLGTSGGSEIQVAAQTLGDWVASGAHRRDLDQNGVYDHTQAVQIMDAWWPRALQAAFQPSLGQELFDSLRSMIHFDDDPNTGSGYHAGSAYIDGWYGYLQKDLRRLLGLPVQGTFSRVYCGGGSLTACRNALRQSLRDALDVPATTLYDEDPVAAGVQRADTCPPANSDQWCWDSVRFRPIGAVTHPTFHWINRPTFQQAVDIQGHRPR